LSFLLTNKIGGYFLSGISSRYSGLFFKDSERMFKIIDRIKAGEKIKQVKNNFYNIEVKRDSFKETFFMPHNYNTLVYELDKSKKAEILLDCRESYDTYEWGRFYEISEEKGKFIVRFIKKEGEKEIFSLYLVIDRNNLIFSKTGQWIKTHYNFDKKRQSHPYEWYIYSALKLKGKRIIFSVGKDKDKAISENNFVIKNLNKLKNKQKKYYEKLLSNIKIKDKNIALVYKSAIASLDSLHCKINGIEGTFAGLPWFFQFWSRDELISSTGLTDNKKIKKILFSHLKGIVHDGRLINIRLPFGDKTNADSIAWLFKRCENVNLNKNEKKRVVRKLEYSIKNIKKHFLKYRFIYSRALETWMDTNWDNDTREGFRIEIQAMFLFMLKFAYKLTKKKEYKKEEEEFRKLVRDEFWNGMVLADGLKDFTVRPNMFIAYYFYPELLTKQEWSLCFQYALSKLWLDWGGLATIDKNHDLFCDEYSGEIPMSYHRGDSWFWINNLAAICMYKNNKERFKKYINQILKAGITNILNGLIGSGSELSSAKELRNEGSPCQAWSNAMFIELVNEMF